MSGGINEGLMKFGLTPTRCADAESRDAVTIATGGRPACPKVIKVFDHDASSTNFEESAKKTPLTKGAIAAKTGRRSARDGT